MDVIGRQAEIRALDSAWSAATAGQPQLAIVWGRRRVGKTFLLTHFAEGKRAAYFTATRQDSEDRQLHRFAERMKEQLGADADLIPDTFPSWEAALRLVIRLAADEPLLLVIDESPRLLTGTSDFADIVSAVWENRVQSQQLMLVLSGSAVAVMEEMIGPHGGLHRRSTLEMRMDPFSLFDARDFLPDLDSAAFIEAYAACGGYPLHLQRWDARLGTDDNLMSLAFTAGGVLLRDAPDIMSEDLDWRGGYERVLAAMSGGPRRRSRIAGRAQQRIDYTLNRLGSAGYVRSVRSMGTSGSPDPLYEIADDYLAFWFAVVRDDADLIEGGQGNAVRLRTVGRWQTHVSRVFEKGARAHAQRLVLQGDLPAETTVGRWWLDEKAEIDVLGLVGEDAVLIGECKWSTRTVGAREFNELRAKATPYLTIADAARFAYWTRGDLEPSAATTDDIWHFGPDDVAGPSGKAQAGR